MALVMDGTGRIVIPDWTPAVRDDFVMEFTYRHNGQYDVHFLAVNNEGTRRVWQDRVGSRSLAITLRANGQASPHMLGSGSDIYTGESVHKVRYVVVPGFASVFVDDEAEPRLPPVAIEPTNELDTWVITVLGALSSTGPSRAGMEFHEVRLIDPNTAGGLNDSIYLLDHTSGVTVVDTGGRAANGTLTDFIDPDAAWTGSAAPTATLSGNLQPGASFTVTYSNFDAIPVSPVTMTDTPPEGGTPNSITRPVTITNTVDGNGKHGGTATGTMPALPSSGSITGLRFGTVNVNLSS